MPELSLTRRPIFRKMSSDAAVALLVAVFALLSPGIANLRTAELNDAELAHQLGKTEKTVEARPRATVSRGTKSAARLRVVRRTGGGPYRLRPSRFHIGHCLANGLRAPLLC